MKQAKYPVGWDEARVNRVLAHYEQQSDDEAVAEDEAAYDLRYTRLWKFQSIWFPLYVSSSPSAGSGSHWADTRSD